MPIRDLAQLRSSILEFLRGGKRPAWEIENELARQFNVTDDEREQIHANSGTRVWTNDVAWALARLKEERKIDREPRKCKTPNGGYRGIYYLSS
jgi:restriction endonuclease Mrr